MLAAALSVGLAPRGWAADPLGAPADDPAGDSFGIFGVARPQGPITASYLRMHHPLYLLDLCRQVNAGALDRARVAALVGGRGTLDALLRRDLDALSEKLMQSVPGAAPPTRSLWDRILTDDGAAPPPPPDVPEALDFGDVGRGDAPQRVLRVTAPSDGSLEVGLPADSPFQILSMRTYTGLIVEVPAVQGRRRVRPLDEVAPRARAEMKVSQTPRAPELARQQAPWVLPAQAGQDVDILLGLPESPAVPPGGAISSTLTVGAPVQGVWRQEVPLLANSALKGDIKIAIGMPEPLIDRVIEYAYNPNVPFTFLVPFFVSNPNPPQAVKGTVQPLSFPPGVSMSNVNFTLQPQQTLDVSFIVAVDRYSQTWQDMESPQNFSVKVSYQTTSIPLASRSETANFVFTLHPATQSWYASGKAGGVQCAQDLVLYADGTVSRFGWCDNRNFYNAKVIAEGALVLPKVVYDVYLMGFFDGPQFRSSSFNSSYFKNNYVWVRYQPFWMSWWKY